MQTGVVDGFEDTACSTITSGTYETAKYVVKSGHATASPLFVCSGITWDGLSQEEKDWLTEAVEKGRQAAMILLKLRRKMHTKHLKKRDFRCLSSIMMPLWQRAGR